MSLWIPLNVFLKNRLYLFLLLITVAISMDLHYVRKERDRQNLISIIVHNRLVSLQHISRKFFSIAAR